MAVTVNIYVKDESVVPIPIEDATVAIVDVVTSAIISQAETDVDGLAAFLLPGLVDPGQNYEVRLFKLGVNFHGLHTIAVMDPPDSGNNTFDVTGADGNIIPISGSSNLCRCQGLFVGLNGLPISNTLVRITSKSELPNQVPKVFLGAMVSGDTLELRTDINGRVSVDLIRTAEYDITFAGNDDEIWPIVVPDAAAVSLIELIHPQPVLWVWDPIEAPGNSLVVSLGETKTITANVTLSDFQEATDLTSYFVITNSNDTIIEVGVGVGLISVKGLALGTTTITLSAQASLPVRFPAITPVAPSLTVTVVL